MAWYDGKYWYRVVGHGASGPVRRDPEAAWAAFYRLHRRDPREQGSFRAATAARLVVATTKPAAEAADISRPIGWYRRGDWWLE